ncbi:GFO-IDH-MocA domain-containing protein [Mycena chlorophos]|uniref:GFO-IDH-MocA domain-containing protein n=1 Tax=Mycena chlorophos TaxID=658473 RepID=A0A8H6T2U3_MYCCL|nr:GFO-IDH-MocA domain-containing protein [Mycena chlorophos]
MDKLSVLMCGTVWLITFRSQRTPPNICKGEYTTGWTAGGASKSDKKIGVVGLTLFDLRRLGKVDHLSMVGVNGGKFPAIRQHLAENIGAVYKDMDLSFDEYPEAGKVDADAYKTAIDKLAPGSAVIIFTPDPTHYPIALYAIERKLHVLVTKPATQLLSHHVELIEACLSPSQLAGSNSLTKAAKKHNVVCFVEHHKRFDPVYSDAKARAQTLGEFNFFSAWMSQPKLQLEVFKSWAGKDSDISFYLSSHHIGAPFFDRAVPTRVVASAATGIATGEPYNCVPQTEDTITLLVDWESTTSQRHRGTAVYTASWTAPLKAGVHSAQHWYYMGEKGDITVDQAHRGYDVTVDDTGKVWFNPMYMKYSPSETGHFDGQHGYGYISIEKFIDAARAVNAGLATPGEFDAYGLPTIANTVLTTAILNAGRVSLDEKRAVYIKKDGDRWVLE